jgi:hypothetical protein
MMCHERLAKDPDHIVFVGWDDVLSTFFADVFAIDGDTIIKKIGTKPREILTVSDLRARVRRYGELDEDAWAKLTRDKKGADLERKAAS